MDKQRKRCFEKLFQEVVRTRKTPGQQDCSNAIKKESFFKTFSWRQVKYAVKNLNATESRRMKKHLNWYWWQDVICEQV